MQVYDSSRRLLSDANLTKVWKGAKYTIKKKKEWQVHAFSSCLNDKYVWTRTRNAWMVSIWDVNSFLEIKGSTDESFYWWNLCNTKQYLSEIIELEYNEKRSFYIEIDGKVEAKWLYFAYETRLSLRQLVQE
jgi:hypothetical protein